LRVTAQRRCLASRPRTIFVVTPFCFSLTVMSWTWAFLTDAVKQPLAISGVSSAKTVACIALFTAVLRNAMIRPFLTVPHSSGSNQFDWNFCCGAARWSIDSCTTESNFFLRGGLQMRRAEQRSQLWCILQTIGCRPEGSRVAERHTSAIS